MTPTFDDLLNHIQDLTGTGYLLISLGEEIAMQEGMIAAIDSAFDEEIYQLGKSLPNDFARKIHKDCLRRKHHAYFDVTIKLDALKRQKAELLVQKEQTRQLLEVGKLQLRSALLDRELKIDLISDL